MRHVVGTMCALLFIGCGLNEEKFEEQYAEAYCTWLEGCAKLSDKYGAMDTCIKAEKISFRPLCMYPLRHTCR